MEQNLACLLQPMGWRGSGLDEPAERTNEHGHCSSLVGPPPTLSPSTPLSSLLLLPPPLLRSASLPSHPLPLHQGSSAPLAMASAVCASSSVAAIAAPPSTRFASTVSGNRALSLDYAFTFVGTGALEFGKWAPSTSIGIEAYPCYVEKR